VRDVGEAGQRARADAGFLFRRHQEHAGGIIREKNHFFAKPTAFSTLEGMPIAAFNVIICAKTAGFIKRATMADGDKPGMLGQLLQARTDNSKK
jgi:hypothetical protein